MARNVGDLKLLFEVVQGPDDGDAQSAPVSLRWPGAEALRKIRVGYFEDDGRTPVTPETRAAVRTAAEGLRRAGFTVEPFRPQGLESARKLWWQFFGVAGGMMLGSMLAGHEPDTSPILLQFLERVKQEPVHTGESLLNAWIQRDLLRTEILKEMREYPILLCPVAAIPAFKHGERSWQVEGKTVEYLDAWSYCEWFNLLGNPAAVVPAGKSPEGLPIGVQIVGRPWEEEMVLSIAEVVEKEAGEVGASLKPLSS
jgi:Asp-tRNA(Asn)/Glu-tRNA(Gln) amidotransferase A subunit family amidase